MRGFRTRRGATEEEMIGYEASKISRQPALVALARSRVSFGGADQPLAQGSRHPSSQRRVLLIKSRGAHLELDHDQLQYRARGGFMSLEHVIKCEK